MPGPLPSRIAEDATIDLINMILLFGQLGMRPRTATSPDYLERASDPSSRFYADYLAYTQGRISRAEMIRRLPHIAMIGDSLSKNFYISSPASMLWRARTERQRDWFLDTDQSPSGIYSLYERLNRITPLVATEYSTSGALVAPSGAIEPFTRRVARTHNLRNQVAQIIQEKRFPDIILLWIGHNNTEWVGRLSQAERRDPARHLPRLAREFGSSYMNDLRPLIDRARTEKHRVALVVFGLADFKSFFQMRQKAEAAHAQDRDRFPYYDATCRYFPALQLSNQNYTTEIGLMMNDELKTMVAKLRRELPENSNVRLEYSDALTRIDLKDLRGFNQLDAWHPSILGHNALADRAFKAIAPSLAFVGVNPKPAMAPERVARVKH